MATSLSFFPSTLKLVFPTLIICTIFIFSLDFYFTPQKFVILLSFNDEKEEEEENGESDGAYLILHIICLHL